MNSDAHAPIPRSTELGAPEMQAAPSAQVVAGPDVVSPVAVSRAVLFGLGAIALAALLVSSFLWQKLSSIQEQLARQSADTAAQSLEARTLARQASELSRDASARSVLFEARLSEAVLQRSQVDELIQSLSRSRDENLVVDIESSIRLAQQQAQLTGSVEPLLSALKSAEQRVVRASQPRLAPLQRAVVRDIERIKSSTVADTPGLLIKLDELVRLADDLVLANAISPVTAIASPQRLITDVTPNWWLRSLQVVRDEAKSLLRVSRIEQPEAVLLSPEQSFFLRENLKLKLLNARLGLLARQIEASRADLAAASLALNRYFDVNSRKTQTASNLLQQVQIQMNVLQLPRVDETLAALTTAAAGK